jgi:Uma2 family endonuclease
MLMTSGFQSATTIETLADLLGQLGDIDPARIRYRPAPGTATEQDVLEIQAREGRLCELVEHVLVEKVMGFRESWLASFLIYTLLSFVKPRNLGIVTGEAGLIRLAPGLVRIPDVAFIAWDRLPDGRIPTAPIPELAPNLAIEVLSASNTSGEMARKRREYFDAGVQLFWIIDPITRTVGVYTNLDQSTLLHETDTLHGGTALPGFTLALHELFGELDQHGTEI